jgi:hypothetical protein
MKREITCSECTTIWRELAAAPDTEREGVTVTLVAGKALRDYRCDGCNFPIHEGAPCHAVGVRIRDDQGCPGWEAEFLDVAAELPS